MVILKQCLEKTLSKRVIRLQDVEEFFRQNGLSRARFLDLCKKSWLAEPALGDECLQILQKAGYGGTIDHLWLSVNNSWKLSRPVAGDKSQKKQVF